MEPMSPFVSQKLYLSPSGNLQPRSQGFFSRIGESDTLECQLQRESSPGRGERDEDFSASDSANNRRIGEGGKGMELTHGLRKGRETAGRNAADRPSRELYGTEKPQKRATSLENLEN